MVRVDSKSGSKISRAGYKDIEVAVRYLLVEAVGVYMMARWGRRAKERLRIGEEFDKLGVDIYDAHRGVPDQPGLIRVIMAGVDEQFLRELAAKAVDNMPKAAMDGKHTARTPVGFKRIYPEGQQYDRHLSSVMVEHEVYGPIMRELFRRYAESWSTRKLALWLNSLPDAPNPNSESGRWDSSWVAQALRRRVYKQFEDTEFGEVEWGRTHKGEWLRYQGPVIHAKGRHPWLCDNATWERVQLRLAGQARARTGTQRGSAPALLHGFLRCPRCGGALTARKACRSHGDRAGDYVCLPRWRATADCQEPGVTMPVGLEGAPAAGRL
jgi:hypothetical protein